PYVNIPVTVAGTPFNFTFSAIGEEPQLVNSDPATLTIIAPGTQCPPPTVVKVQCTEQVETAAATDTKGTKGQATLLAASGAQAGGPRFTQPSGLFCVSFPQGFPPQTGGGGGGGINFPAASVQGLMNTSQLNS